MSYPTVLEVVAGGAAATAGIEPGDQLVAVNGVAPSDVIEYQQLVDEPFVGLDRTGRAVLLDLLSDVHADGAALLIATHETSTAGAGDRVIALAAGELIFDGVPDDADLAALTDGISPSN